MSEVSHDHKLQAATESTLAKAVGRFITPSLLLVIAWVAKQDITEIKERQKDQSAVAQQQSIQILETRSDMKLLNAKVDYSVLQQMDNMNSRIKLLEDQNRVLRQPDESRDRR